MYKNLAAPVDCIALAACFSPFQFILIQPAPEPA
jgi:hypothetical protein